MSLASASHLRLLHIEHSSPSSLWAPKSSAAQSPLSLLPTKLGSPSCRVSLSHSLLSQPTAICCPPHPHHNSPKVTGLPPVIQGGSVLPSPGTFPSALHASPFPPPTCFPPLCPLLCHLHHLILSRPLICLTFITLKKYTNKYRGKQIKMT